jgi:hypothetical protein
MKQISLLIIILSFCFAVFSQENSCPRINLIVPDDLLYPEQSVTFIIKVENGKQSSKLQYFWIVSGGKIIKGQGQSELEFQPTEEDESLRLGIAVKVIGLPEPCADTVSQFVNVAGLPIGEPVDGFGKVPFSSYKLRLDSFLIAVNDNPDSEGLIELKFDKRDSRNYKISLLNNIIKFLEFRKFDKKRITFAIGEIDFEQTELWVVTQGSKFPRSRTADYKRVSEENYQIIKAEEFTQKIKDLCL